jgi:hypothetical protein
VDVVGYIRVIVDSDAGIGVRWVAASSVSVAVWLIKAVPPLQPLRSFHIA